MSTVWLEQQTSSFTSQESFIASKPIITKRKRTDHDNVSNKRKIVTHSTTTDDYERLSLSPRMPAIIPKVAKSSHFINRSLSSMTFFQCQLCRRYLKNKDIYMDHMIKCSVQNQISIKIVRAKKDKSQVSVL